MVLGWEVSAGWQWVVWACLMGFFCFAFVGLSSSMIINLDRYEDAWWNRKPVSWTLLGLWGIFLLSPIFSDSLMHFAFTHLATPSGISRFIKTTMPSNRVLIAVERIMEDLLFSYFILAAYLGFGRSTKIREWTSRRFNSCLAAIFLFWWGFRIFTGYLVYRLNGSVILGFDVWEAIFHFRGPN